MKGFDWIFFAVMTPPFIMALVGIARAGVFRLKLPNDVTHRPPAQRSGQIAPPGPPESPSQPFTSR